MTDLTRQWAIKRYVLRTCSRPTSGIPAYAATDLANESVPGPNNMIFFGSWVRNSWRTFCPNPKLPFGKQFKFFSVITKKIALYLYDTSSLPSTWHDLYWLLFRWYKSPPSPMPCMWRDWEAGSREVQTSRLPYLHRSHQRLESNFTGLIKWSVYKLTNE